MTCAIRRQSRSFRRWSIRAHRSTPSIRRAWRWLAHVLPEGVTYTENAYDAAEGADALIIVTEWNAFRALDFDRLGKIMRDRILVDLRNIYRREEIERHGFAYMSVGRPDEDIAPQGISSAAS